MKSRFDLQAKIEKRGVDIARRLPYTRLTASEADTSRHPRRGQPFRGAPTG